MRLLAARLHQGWITTDQLGLPDQSDNEIAKRHRAATARPVLFFRRQRKDRQSLIPGF
jgi:hypothetical protein